MSEQNTSQRVQQAPRLETERLIMRAHRRADFASNAQMWADPAVAEHISGVPSTIEESWSRFLRYFGMWPLLGYGYWAVEDRKSGAFVGEVGFSYFKRKLSVGEFDAPEAGWVLSPLVHGRGYATEAVMAALEWADETLDVPRFVCMIDPEYQASRRVAEKCGFSEFAMAQYKGQPAALLQRLRSTASQDG